MSKDNIIIEYFKLFEQFCLLINKSWPTNDTTHEEMVKAYRICSHIEQCVDTMHSRNILSDFLDGFKRWTSVTFNEKLIINPKCYLLHKIVSSDINLNLIDEGINSFLQVFSDDKLESCLTEIIKETASKRVLVDNLNNICNYKEIRNEIILKLSNDDIFNDIIEKKDDKMLEIILEAMTSNIIIYSSETEYLKKSLYERLNEKSFRVTWLWEAILKQIDKKLLVKICSDFQIFDLILSVLFDSTRLLENEEIYGFHISMSNVELKCILICLLSDIELKNHALDVIRLNNFKSAYWNLYL